MKRVEVEVPGAGRLQVQTHEDRDPYISGCLQLGKIFEPHILQILRLLLRRGDHFLDVGANLGWFAMIGSRIVGKDGRVFAVEPDPDNHRLLTANLATNGCGNARTYRCAAGSRRGRTVFSRSATNRGDHRVGTVQGALETIAVKLRPVDGLLWPRRRLDFALLDTQGSEVSVLRGMNSILDRNPAMRLIFEYWPHGLRSCGSSAAELAAILEARRWKLWLLEDGAVRPIQAHEVASLAEAEYHPDQLRHADIVAASPEDAEASAIMQTLTAQLTS